MDLSEIKKDEPVQIPETTKVENFEEIENSDKRKTKFGVFFDKVGVFVGGIFKKNESKAEVSKEIIPEYSSELEENTRRYRKAIEDAINDSKNLEQVYREKIDEIITAEKNTKDTTSELNNNEKTDEIITAEKNKKFDSEGYLASIDLDKSKNTDKLSNPWETVEEYDLPKSESEIYSLDKKNEPEVENLYTNKTNETNDIKNNSETQISKENKDQNQEDTKSLYEKRLKEFLSADEAVAWWERENPGHRINEALDESANISIESREKAKMVIENFNLLRESVVQLASKLNPQKKDIFEKALGVVENNIRKNNKTSRDDDNLRKIISFIDREIFQNEIFKDIPNISDSKEKNSFALSKVYRWIGGIKPLLKMQVENVKKPFDSIATKEDEINIKEVENKNEKLLALERAYDEYQKSNRRQKYFLDFLNYLKVEKGQKNGDYYGMKYGEVGDFYGNKLDTEANNIPEVKTENLESKDGQVEKEEIEKNKSDFVELKNENDNFESKFFNLMPTNNLDRYKKDLQDLKNEFFVSNQIDRVGLEDKFKEIIKDYWHSQYIFSKRNDFKSAQDFDNFIKDEVQIWLDQKDKNAKEASV